MAISIEGEVYTGNEPLELKVTHVLRKKPMKDPYWVEIDFLVQGKRADGITECYYFNGLPNLPLSTEEVFTGEVIGRRFHRLTTPCILTDGQTLYLSPQGMIFRLDENKGLESFSTSNTHDLFVGYLR